MHRKAMLVLLAILITMACMAAGCTIGVKQTNRLVFVSPVPIPEAAKGAPMVATNDKIPLAVLDRPDEHYSQRVAGYVLVDPWFYQRLIDTWNQRDKK
jgi:hypothetical protein